MGAEEYSEKFKKCYACQKFFHLESFHKNHIRKDGLEQTCKECLLKRSRDYYERNKEKVLQRTANWGKENKEKKRASCRRWRKKYPERQRAATARWEKEHPEEKRLLTSAWHMAHKAELAVRAAAYYAAHQDEIAVKKAAYRAAHPEGHRASDKRRRAAKANAPLNDFTGLQWQEMQAAYFHRCVYCNRRAKGHLTQDHITPLSKDGSHTLSNIVPACRSCNSKKHAGSPRIPVQPLML